MRRDHFSQRDAAVFRRLHAVGVRAGYGLLLLLLLLALVPVAGAAPPQQTDGLDESGAAQALLASLTPLERVGQLFLVTFEGDAAPLESDIADLILNHRIGGVVLLADNDNITGYGNLDNVPLQVAELTNDLQRLALLGITTSQTALEGSENDPDAVPLVRLDPTVRTPIPLLVATSQEGGGYPYSQIFNGLTDVPNNMALGATWDPQQAAQAGEVLGQELAALGVNMLIGPSLDVLEDPRPFSISDLGTRSFGGDPYWVGVMGGAYTQGVQTGSNGRIAVIPKHFPGYGSSDRPLHEEVPTVRKSLTQLQQIELAPFATVTGGDIGVSGIADGLLTTHIRYQGFQGNIRATTNPVSFDQAALSTLMAQEEFASWRQGGGLLVSDKLGVRAVERFVDDTGQTFPHRQIARDALLAGNDLLYVAEFALGGDNVAAEVENIKDTLAWFEELYNNDPAFQQQVDTAVLRILRLKLRLYGGDISPENILVDTDQLDDVVGVHAPQMMDIAREAITLLSPTVEELANRVPQLPGPDANIVIFTDLRSGQQCSSCPEQPLIDVAALEERILARYGPEASDQIQPDQIESFALSELQAFLNAGPGPIVLPTPVITATAVPTNTVAPPTADISPPVVPSPTPEPPPAGYLAQEALREADWILFAMVGPLDNAGAISQFLAQRPDLVRETQVIVFSYGAPYYLDTTEISQLTAYFAAYTPGDAFLTTSLRALFQEIPLRGAPPVDVEGIRYDLFTQTQPDPDQVIALFVLDDDEDDMPLAVDNEPLGVSVGDTLRLQTGVILDHNGNPVPDGTPVRFIQRDRVQGLVNIIDEKPTVDGVAQLDYVLEARTEAGQFQITAESGAATISLEVNIAVGASPGEAQVSIFTPIPPPTSTPTATPEPTETPTPTATVTPPPTVTPPAPAANGPQIPSLLITLDEFQMLFAVVAGLGVVVGAGVVVNRRHEQNQARKLGLLLWGLIGGLILYNYFALGLPGSAVLVEMGSWAAIVTTLTGGAIGLFVYWLWFLALER